MTTLLLTCGWTWHSQVQRHGSMRCPSAVTSGLSRWRRCLCEKKRPDSEHPGRSRAFPWCQHRFRKFCPTVPCGVVIAFLFATCESTASGILEKKKSKKPIREVARWRTIEYGMFLYSIWENGNRRICRAGNRVRGLPGTADPPLVLFPWVLLPVHCNRE